MYQCCVDVLGLCKQLLVASSYCALWRFSEATKLVCLVYATIYNIHGVACSLYPVQFFLLLQDILSLTYPTHVFSVVFVLGESSHDLLPLPTIDFPSSYIGIPEETTH